MRGDDPATFQRALGAALGEVELVREVQRAYDPDAAHTAAMAAVAPIAAPQDNGWNSPPPQQQAPAAPAQPQGVQLPPTLSRYNTLIPGMPTQACAVCGQTAYPVTFQSKQGKTFKKYKCGVDDRGHDNDWIK